MELVYVDKIAAMGGCCNMVDNTSAQLKAKELLGSQERVCCVELHFHKVKEYVIFQVKSCMYGSEGWLSWYSG
jgi:hypothetical protein